MADNLGKLRFIAVAPNGDVYVKVREGGIIALRDRDGDGRAETKQTFGGGGGSGIAVRDGWLYHSSNSAVFRYRMAPGELVPKGPQETIVSGLPEGKEHFTKNFAFDGEGRLLVEVGSPSNALGVPDRQKGAKGQDATEFLQTKGGFWRFDPAKANQTQKDGFHFTTGQRHVMAVIWSPKAQAFLMVMNGRDLLHTVDPEHYTVDDNAELPAEEMHLLKEGANYGWPYTYWDPLKKARMMAPEYGGDNEKRAEAGQYPDPLIAFPGHWAPLQMVYYDGTQFPAKYRGGAFVAFHGSWNRAPRPQKGYNVRLRPPERQGPARRRLRGLRGRVLRPYRVHVAGRRPLPSGRSGRGARRLALRDRHGEGPRLAHLLHGRRRRRRPRPPRRDSASFRWRAVRRLPRRPLPTTTRAPAPRSTSRPAPSAT